jgi:hypothetical protein
MLGWGVKRKLLNRASTPHPNMFTKLGTTVGAGEITCGMTGGGTVIICAEICGGKMTWVRKFSRTYTLKNL